MNQLPMIISADDHVLEPADIWTSRVPARFRDAAPHVVRRGQPIMRQEEHRKVYTPTDEGPPCDYWAYDGDMAPLLRSFAMAGQTEDTLLAGVTFDDVRPGCYIPKERVKDMDLVGVEKSLCFPNTLPRFCGQRFLEAKDKELSGLLVRAYNDWMIEEWCGDSGGRLVPMCMIQLWDPEAAAAEVRRNAARGARAITFCELPAELGLPSIHDVNGYWEPVFRACSETSTVICIHIFSSSKLPRTSIDAPGAVTMMASANNAVLALGDWLFSGIFERYPNLKIVLSEAEIGWIPYALERADRVWEMLPVYDRDAVRRPPSEYFADHVYGSFISDKHGVESIDKIGINNVLFEVDYPHADSSWPDSLAVAARELASLDDAGIEAILRGNAIKLFDLH
jgi:predicted TIM-barrel fold metal-dependent hydrolase